MKLQIKTLNQKCLVIDIEETKTILDLKKELALYPDVGVKPELQKLIYSGKILNNEDKISAYNIDVKKFLVIMILKLPMAEFPVVSKDAKKEEPQHKEEPVNMDIEEILAEFKTPPSVAAGTTTTPNDSKNDAMVSQIVAMGYPEKEVRRALRASFNNPERAIQYLVEGIPTSPSTPEGDSYTDTDADLAMTPFEVFRGEPAFQDIRSALQADSDLIDGAIQRIGETNPSLLDLINENQQEFLTLLIEGGEENDVYGDEDDSGEEEEEEDSDSDSS